MSKIAMAVVASLLTGFGVGAFLIERDTKTRQEVAPVEEFAAAASDDQRLQYLERIVREERDARLVLEEQLVTVLNQLDSIELARASEPAPRAGRESQPDDAGAERSRQRDLAAMMRNFQDRRVAALIEGGFSEDEAKRLLALESAAQYKAMSAAHEAERNGEVLDLYASGQDTQSTLRKELGDVEYERYLAAQGQPTTVRVASVLSGSPGGSAGLLPGDQIVSYNGERTFSMYELRQLTLQGAPGQDVVIQIERDGVPMQLSVPRGPIGMNGAGARLRGTSRWGG